MRCSESKSEVLFIPILLCFLQLACSQKAFVSDHNDLRFVERTKIIPSNKYETQRKSLYLPKAYINGHTVEEKNINQFIDSIYGNEDGWRYDISQFKGARISPNLYKLEVGYEYTFDTSPGLWWFDNVHFFDKNGHVVKLKMMINSSSVKDFVRISNKKKERFVETFRSDLDPNEADIEEFERRITATLESNDTFFDINEFYSLRIDIQNKKLNMHYDWDYAFGLGPIILPDIVIEFQFHELIPYLSDYGREVLFLRTNLNSE